MYGQTRGGRQSELKGTDLPWIGHKEQLRIPARTSWPTEKEMSCPKSGPRPGPRLVDQGCQPSQSEPESGARQGPPSGPIRQVWLLVATQPHISGATSTAQLPYKRVRNYPAALASNSPMAALHDVNTHGRQGASTLYILYVQQTAAIVSDGRHTKLANRSPRVCSSPNNDGLSSLASE